MAKHPTIRGRVEGIDGARGLAALIMIQGHAYHGWVAPEHQVSAGYQLTRLLGTLPLPAFLILSGAAVAWRVEAAARRGEHAAAVRRRVVWRGLQIVLWGYATSLAYALLDGGRTLDTLLRADVLHAIGLGIALLGGLGIRAAASGSPDPRWFARTALAVGIGATALCPWLSQATAATPGPARYVVGLFAEVPGVTRMPVVPLVAWTATGALAVRVMIGARDRHAPDDLVLRTGAPTGTLVGLAAVGLGAAVIGTWGRDALVELLGGTASRAHPAIWANVLDLAGRGVLVLALGAWLVPRLPEPARGMLLRLGRGSLVAYVVHIPFCYGILGGPLVGASTMTTATAFLVALLAISYGAVWLRDRIRPRPRPSPSRAAVG